MKVLGISAYYHDSGAALVIDGEIIAAAQEERFTRIKHDAAFPHHAIAYCLREAGNTIDAVVFYEKPFIKFERLLETYMAFAPRGFASFKKAMPVWLKEKLFQRRLITQELKKIGLGHELPLLFSEHHLSHAASAFFPSPFKEAVVLTMDGVGEWATTSAAIGRDNTLVMTREIHFPHSLGLLYSAFTYYTGFKVNSGEYKVMGLAPYSVPRYADKIMKHLIDIKEDGSFRLDLSYFDYCTGLTMTNEKFHALFEGKPRASGERLSQRHMDIAASIQKVTEEVMIRITRSLAKQTGIPNLCMAGGVALNCVANGKIQKDGAFKNIWIQPAAGDAGGALGAALAAYHLHMGGRRTVSGSGDAMKGSYLGPSFSNEDIKRRLTSMGAVFTVLTDDELILTSAEALSEGKALGWFQGRMEFGPRALGARSILGDARSPTMQSVLNLKIKYRESFRPFAPSVLSEDTHRWFDLETDSPYMLLVAEVLEEHRYAISAADESLSGIDKLKVVRSTIPAVTHVDYSARIQTVHKKTNPRYHRLIQEFKNLTGCPVIVNTSFNVRGEPIVGTPEDAFRCFMGTEIEALAVGNCYLKKEQQDSALKKDYKNNFELD